MPKNEDFEKKYRHSAHFLYLMMSGEEITPQTERLVRERAIFAFYFAYIGIKLSTGGIPLEVVSEAQRIVERYQADHPYQFKPGKETGIDDLTNKVMKLEKELADHLGKKK